MFFGCQELVQNVCFFNRTRIVEDICSLFFLWLPLHDFFSDVFRCTGIFFCFAPSRPLKKMMARPLLGSQSGEILTSVYEVLILPVYNVVSNNTNKCQAVINTLISERFVKTQ